MIDEVLQFAMLDVFLFSMTAAALVFFFFFYDWNVKCDRFQMISLRRITLNVLIA